jgi:resolvase-like protein
LERPDLYQPFSSREGYHRHKLERSPLFWLENREGAGIGQKESPFNRGAPSEHRGELLVKHEGRKTNLRCAIYTRVSTENGLGQEFNSLDNQREASEAYIRSQAHEGWKLIRDRYDDGGFSGGSETSA